MQCQSARLYFKWNNAVHLLYPQNADTAQYVAIDLGGNDQAGAPSQLLDVLNADYDTDPLRRMKCYANPSGTDIASTLLAPLCFDDE